MKRSLLLALVLAPVGAHAGLESVLNPLLLTNPAANPLGMALPLGGALLAPSLLGSPFGGGITGPFSGAYGSPLGGYGGPLGGYGNPLTGYGGPLGGLGSPLGGLGGASLLRPAIQVAPGLLSFQHQAPQMLINPYMGGPFSQQPFAQPSRPPGFGGNPFGVVGYGAQTSPYGYVPNVLQSQPNPAAGFAGWPGMGKPAAAPSIPVQPANPYLPQSGVAAQAQAQTMMSPSSASTPQPTMSAAQTASAQALAGTIVDLLKSLAAVQPAVPSGPAPTSVPFTSPWGADAAAASGQIGQPAVTPLNPWGSAPVSQVTAVQAAPTPEAPSQAQLKHEEGALTPFDPAYWLLPPELPEPEK